MAELEKSLEGKEMELSEKVGQIEREFAEKLLAKTQEMSKEFQQQFAAAQEAKNGEVQLLQAQHQEMLSRLNGEAA